MGIGLALSGGGAKGIAHIGIIEALQDYGIQIDYIAGTSSGSIIAALYASGYTPNEILKIVNYNKDNFLDIDKKIGFKLLGSIFSKKVSIKGFIKGNRLEKIVNEMLRNKNVQDISDVHMPLAIPVIDLKTGEKVYFINNIKNANKNKRQCLIEENTKYDDVPSYYTEGSLASIVRASCGVPGIFVPKKIGDSYYIDGGVRVNTPVEILKQMGAEKILAVTFNCNKKQCFSIQNVIGISSQAFNIMTHSSNIDEVNMADVNVRLCLNDTALFDVSNPTYLAKRGYNIIAKNIIRIKQKLDIDI